MFTITKCECGAITVSDDGVDNSMTVATFEAEYPDIRLKFEDKIFYSCNHCVNHWGIDLCGCGSGELVGDCDYGFKECKNNIPAQIKGEQKKSIGWAR